MPRGLGEGRGAARKMRPGEAAGIGDKILVEIAEIDSRGTLSLVPIVEGKGGDAADAPDGDE